MGAKANKPVVQEINDEEAKMLISEHKKYLRTLPLSNRSNMKNPLNEDKNFAYT